MEVCLLGSGILHSSEVCSKVLTPPSTVLALCLPLLVGCRNCREDDLAICGCVFKALVCRAPQCVCGTNKPVKIKDRKDHVWVFFFLMYFSDPVSLILLSPSTCFLILHSTCVPEGALLDEGRSDWVVETSGLTPVMEMV